jgi:2-dehydro-3-deoxygluconokinase
MKPHPRYDLAAIGETMVSLVSYDDPTRFHGVMAGAESNVAAGMVGLGCRTQWVSRLGDDPFADVIVASLEAAGVDLAVVRDAGHPTGLMTKHLSGSERVTGYYRRQSAARLLSASDLERMSPADWIHVTGITPALSESAADLVAAVVEHRNGHDARVSFDVNLRPTLWADLTTAARTIVPLAQQADVVFIGADEAEALVGTSSAAAVADIVLRRTDQELILKQGSEPASAITFEGVVSVPALPIEVVDPTGAGDAFAAGYLTGRCRRWDRATSLRLGHLMASRVLQVTEDVPPPLPADELAALSPEWLARALG